MSKKNREKRQEQAQAKEEAVAKGAMPDLIEFDIWWVMKSDAIPKHHMKEVIKADFKGRGLSNLETVETFDKALKAYGL